MKKVYIFLLAVLLTANVFLPKLVSDHHKK